jgi:tetratricopeptide (TPR) repeat protein
MEKAKTIAVNIAVIAVIALVLIWGNTLYRQHAQFDKGEKALAAGNYIAAIAGYESAIHMYTPGSSLVGRAAEKLWGIGERYEQTGDREKALVAYRALRSSFYAVRGLYSPGSEWIARSEAKIAQLVGQTQAEDQQSLNRKDAKDAK